MLRVGLQTRTAEAASRRPANLTFVVDVSGSMADPGRLDLVRDALHTENGLLTGYQEAARAFRPVATNRVILLSDGLANTGNTSWQGILDRVEEHAGRQITLLCVGVGREYGDSLMEQLADHGDGAAVYVSTVEEVVASYRLVGYENRTLAPEDFRDDAKDGGEVGPGHSVTALYALRLRSGATGQVAMATVRWQDPETREPAELIRTAASLA